MDDAEEIVSAMTVTISKQVIHLFHQNNVDFHQFLKSKNGESHKSGSCTVNDVSGTYQLTGSYKGIVHIRQELLSQVKMFTAGEHRQLQSQQNTEDIERLASTQETRDDVGGATPLTSPKSLQGDDINKSSESREDQLSADGMMQESLLKPKRIRKLKSPTPECDTSVETDAQGELAESRVDESRASDDERRKFNDSNHYESFEVDRDYYQYLMTHCEDELIKQLPQFHAFEDEAGKYKVAFALNSKKRDGKAKYMSFVGRLRSEIVRLPDEVDGSVLLSIVTACDDKDTSFVLDEVNKTCKLIGQKKQVAKMKKLIEEHISEQLKPSKEGAWQVHSNRKGKKTDSTFSFYMEHGKLSKCDSSQSPATKNCSLQVSLLDSKTKAPTAETIVRAVDSKMQSFGDAKAAIKFESIKKYQDECRKIVNEHHNNVPVGTVAHTTMTCEFQKKAKIKYILHVVLEDKKKARTESVVAVKDVVYRCLHDAENVLQTNSITFPHLGGSDYCDIGSFVRGSVQALQSLKATNQLKRVCFFAKDSKTLQELAREFESCVDHPHKSHLASSSESSYNGHSTSL